MSQGDHARLGAGREAPAADSPDATVTTVHELRTADGARVNGVLRVVPGATTVVVIMHPRQESTFHPLIPLLLHGGYAVWTQSTRGGLNDVNLLHEQALLDMAAGHEFCRDRGFESVVSLGHSGGASLATYYTEQACATPAERVSATPGGRPVPLADAVMPVPDALVLMAPHPGQGQLLRRVIDPSVTDESDPMSIDPTLNPYAPANGFATPPSSSRYSPEFVERYRAAQAARVSRLDERARELVAAASEARTRFATSEDPDDRRASLATTVMTVYRTDADLRGVDLSLDPNQRPYGSLFGRRPDLTNYGLVGFGRLVSPEAWLSTWSAISSKASLLRSAPGANVPVLLIELTGDQACFPADARAMVAAFPHDDVSHVEVAGTHFGGPLRPGEPSGATLAGEAVTHWLGRRVPSAGFVST